METDCSKVASHLNDLPLDYSPFHIFIKNILWLCNRFHSVSFSWVSRMCNSAAHNLAKFAVFSPGLNIWMKFLPPCIASAVACERL